MKPGVETHHLDSVDPKDMAHRLEKLRHGNADWHARARAKKAKVIIGDLLDPKVLCTQVSRRHLEVAFLFLGGMTLADIATCMGYAPKTGRGHVSQIMHRPEMVALVARVREAQLERIISGEYGVRAQAKAAAPKAMKKAIDLVEDAAKDGDKLRAVDTVLTVSGDKVERQEHLHTHALLGQMDAGQLRRYADTGELPPHLAHIGEALEKRRALPPPDESA
jgi:DNA-binding CsgD family transcriptional regulator